MFYADAVLKAGHFHIEDTAKFLDRLVPRTSLSDTLIDAIFLVLVEEGFYSENSESWTIFPTSYRALESEMYRPFIQIANVIVDYLDDKKLTKVSGEWRDVHNKAPNSNDVTAPLMRPNIAFVSYKSSVQAIQDKIDCMSIQTNNASQKHIKQLKLKMKELSHIWWLQVWTVLEMKSEATLADVILALQQVCCYVRQMFREQLDRRFALGLTLCGDQLSVFLFDRSGVLGTRTSINIHKDPKSLICVIASFSVLDPDQLGWDPNMEIYYPGIIAQSIPSYKFPFNAHNTNLYQINWVITSCGKDRRSREKFLTVRALSILGAEVMCGRANIVWEVVKLDDRKNCDKEVFVLKQGWQRFATLDCIVEEPLEEPFEAQAHRTADMYEGRIYSSEHVRIHGKVDTTIEHIRQGLGGIAAMPLGIQNKPKIITSPMMSNSDQETIIHEAFVYKGQIHYRHRGSPPVSRVFTRIIMMTYGWQIEFFKDHLELLTVLRDAVQDHLKFYSAGILHRDVSPGNILICPRGGDVTDTHGRLIDLDHAKETTQFHTIGISSDSHTDQAGEIIHKVLISLGKFVDIDVARTVVSIFEDQIHGISYIGDALERFRDQPTQENPSTLASLGWQIGGNLPNFKDQPSRKGARTGTVPYMSHEVLSKPDNRNWTHDAVHDMESFFWVLVYLALTRGGPGGHRRQELEQADAGGHSELHEIIGQLFDYSMEELAVTKFNLFKPMPGLSSNFLENKILPQFHPYFDPLKPLVRSWHQLLVLAFRWRSLEYIYIHDFVLDLIEKEIKQLDTMPPHEATTSELEVSRRSKRRDAISNAFLNASGRVTPDRDQDRAHQDLSPDMVDKSMSNTALKRAVLDSPSSETNSRPDAKRIRAG